MQKPAHSSASGASVAPELKAQYDQYYDGISEWRELGAVDKVDNILRLGQHCPHDRVLDVGAGEGAVVAGLARKGFAKSYAAVDISESAVAALRGREVPGLESAEVFDGYQLPFEDRSFDLAYLSHVVEHVEHPRVLLREVARVAPYVFVEVPLEETTRSPRDYVDDGVGHINFYSHRTIRKLMQQQGFEVVEQIFTLPGKALLEYKYGWRATLRRLPKLAYLKVNRDWALNRFSYFSALLCKSP